jgi:hypothetical protein
MVVARPDFGMMIQLDCSFPSYLLESNLEAYTSRKDKTLLDSAWNKALRAAKGRVLRLHGNEDDMIWVSEAQCLGHGLSANLHVVV